MIIKNNENVLKMRLKDTLNRSLVYTAFPKDKPLSFSIMFDKRSSGLEVQYNTKSDMIIKNDVKVRLHRDLRSCIFCQTFFNLESIEDDRKDFRCKFDSVNPMFKTVIFPFCSEMLDLKTSNDMERCSSDEGLKNITNYLSVTGWKVFDYESDLIYYFVERKIFNVITRNMVIRSMGIQLTTDRGYAALLKYNDYYKANDKTDKKVIIPSYLSDEDDNNSIIDFEKC